jgi:hypothetical protein
MTADNFLSWPDMIDGGFRRMDGLGGIIVCLDSLWITGKGRISRIGLTKRSNADE